MIAEVQLGELALPDNGDPMLLEILSLVDPTGAYVLDHFVAERIGPRGGREPMGNAIVYRPGFSKEQEERERRRPRETGGVCPAVVLRERGRR